MSNGTLAFNYESRPQGPQVQMLQERHGDGREIPNAEEEPALVWASDWPGGVGYGAEP